jgi:hypothetical protein
MKMMKTSQILQMMIVQKTLCQFDVIRLVKYDNSVEAQRQTLICIVTVPQKPKIAFHSLLVAVIVIIFESGFGEYYPFFLIARNVLYSNCSTVQHV